MEHTFVLHELPRDINIDQKVRNVGFFLLERKIMKQPVHDRIHDLWIAGDNALFVFCPDTKQKYTTFDSLSGASNISKLPKRIINSDVRISFPYRFVTHYIQKLGNASCSVF